MITVVNKTVYSNPGELGTDTFAIPATTKGNTLVMVVAYSANSGFFASLTDNAGDVFIEGNNQPSGLPSAASTDIWYAINIAGGATSISYVSSLDPRIWVYELSCVGTLDDDQSENAIILGAIIPPSIAAPSVTGIKIFDFYVSVLAIVTNAHNPPGPGQNITGVSAPWTLDTVLPLAFGLDVAAAAYFIGAGAPEQAVFTQDDGGVITGGYASSAAAFGALPGPCSGGPSPNPPCAPVDGAGHLASGTLINDLNLFIGPATALYKTSILPVAINAYETTNEGRNAVVLDFNQGDGLYARDLGTIFSWPLITEGKPKTILYVWQPSIIPMPEGVYGRATDWMDGGTPGDKFIQGVMVEADSFNNAKTFFLEDSDTLSLHALNETPAIFNKQSEKAFSCIPFVAHSARIISVDGIEWRVWSSRLVFQPWPESCLNWQTEMTSLGLTGWGHVREMNIPHQSLSNLTLVLTFDAWPTITLTIPSSGGVQKKTKVTLPPNKFKLMGLRIFSATRFYLFRDDLELKIKNWGSTESYKIIRPFGGPTKIGALV